jgi:hypothetical protein
MGVSAGRRISNPTSLF